MSITAPLIDFVHQIAEAVPLPWFTAIASLAEEVIAIIPSPFVMTLAGSLAASLEHHWSYLILLAVIGAVAKTFGSWIIYIIADKAEDILIDKFGRVLGVSHQDTEGLGKLFNHGRRDDFIIFASRALPIMPTAPISVVAGLLKLNIKTYLLSTFFGLVLRNLFYLYVGFTSLGALESVNDNLDSLENIGYVVLFFAMFGLMIWFYRQRRLGAGGRLLEKLRKR